VVTFFCHTIQVHPVEIYRYTKKRKYYGHRKSIQRLDFVFDQAYLKLKPNGKFFICELHPFKQYTGSKAKFETENGTEELKVFVHHISEYLDCAKKSRFQLLEIKEWFDEINPAGLPRLVSFVFEK
jgi:hypothetical protein